MAAEEGSELLQPENEETAEQERKQEILDQNRLYSKNFLELKQRLEQAGSSITVHLYTHHTGNDTAEKLHLWRQEKKQQQLHVSIQSDEKHVNVTVSQREGCPFLRLKADIAPNVSMEKEKQAEELDKRIDCSLKEIAKIIKLAAEEGSDVVVVDCIKPQRLENKAIEALLKEFRGVYYNSTHYSLNTEGKVQSEKMTATTSNEEQRMEETDESPTPSN